MTSPASPIERAGRWLEPLLALAVLAGLCHAMWFLGRFGYLPPPFFYIASDTFMDWFNTAYWAHQPGAYDSWRTLYAPLSFVVLKIMTNPACYPAAEGITSRDCDSWGLFTLHAWFVINAVLAGLALRKADPATALPRAFAVAAGLPMLYALERGQLLVPTFACMVLAFGPLLRQAWARWLALALAINLKIYLLAALFPQLLRRRWRWFEGGLIATIIVYLLSLALFGSGTPVVMYNNIVDARGIYQAIDFIDQWYASTYQPLLSLLDGDFFPILAVLGSDLLEGTQVVLPLLLRVTQASILLAAAAAWLRPEAVSMHRLTALGIGMAFITVESNGYTQCILTFLVFLERFRAPGVVWAIIASYILAIPFDVPLYPIALTVDESFLAGRPVIIENVLTAGPFIRPLLIMSVPFALAWQTIADVRRDLLEAPLEARRRFAGDFAFARWLSPSHARR